MENPGDCFSTGIPVSKKGNDGRLNHGSNGVKTQLNAFTTKNGEIFLKNDSGTLLSSIAQENGVYFNPSIQDGDQSELFYSIVYGSDLPVGENISIPSPQPLEVSNNTKFNTPENLFRTRANSFSSVDVIIEDVEEPLDSIPLSVPDFSLLKTPDVHIGLGNKSIEEHQKKQSDNFPSVDKGFEFDELLENFNAEKDIFSVTVTSDSGSGTSPDSSAVIPADFYKNSLCFQVPDSPFRLTSDTEILDNSYGLVSPGKKLCQEFDDGALMRAPIVLSDGSTRYIICSKEELGQTSLASVNEGKSSKNTQLENIEEIDKNAIEWGVECILESDVDGLSVDGVSQCFQESDIIDYVTSVDKNIRGIESDFALEKLPTDLDVPSSPLQTNEIEQNEATNDIDTAAANVSITTDKVNKKMQIIITTSEGQQLIEIDTDTSLNLQQGESDDCLPVASVKDGKSQQKANINGKNKPQELALSETEANNILRLVKSSVRGKPKKFRCPIEGCDVILDKECKLRVHLIGHKGARPFKCTVIGCDWAFTTPYRLRRHYETHFGKKDFICDYEGCNRRFTTVYNLNTHKRRHIWPNELICPAEGCEMSFANRRKMELHLKVHENIEAPYNCSICGKKYYSANCIASHYRTHQYSEDDFKCPYAGCGKKYDKICRLKQHLRHHTGDRPYCCPFQGCNWSFMSASKLTRHMRKHTGERKFVCPEPGCGKSFMRPEHLKGHAVIHSGDKPFHCPHENCNARFTAKSSLYVHVKKHCATGVKVVYGCPVAPCTKKYNNKTTLRQHVQKAHGDVVSDSNAIDVQEKLEVTMPVPLPSATKHLPDHGAPSIRTVVSQFRTKKVLKQASTGDSVSLTSANSSKTSNVVPVSSNSNLISKSEKIRSQIIDCKGALSSSVSGVKHEINLTSCKLLQENNSGAARTDYCCSRVSRTSKKTRSLPVKNHLGSLLSDDRRLVTSDDPRMQESDESFASLAQSALDIRSQDVMLASSSVAFHEQPSDSLVPSNFLPDDPSSIVIYQEDLLNATADFGSDLQMGVSLLSEHCPGFSVQNGVDEFTESGMHLQCLEEVP